MASNALFVGWNRPGRGQEGPAVETFQKLLAYLAKQQQSSGIESFEPVFLSPHGGDLNGFVLVRGAHDKLEALRWSQEFQDISTHANFQVDGFGVLSALIGAEIQPQMKRYQQAVAAK